MSHDFPLLPWPAPLQTARFLVRPHRFAVDARLDTGRRVQAHLADPGRLRELLIPGRTLALEHCPRPHRRTQWTARLVRTPDDDGWVSLDTQLPNRLVRRALEADILAELAAWSLVRAEVQVGSSRLDFLLANARGTRLALEVKSVTLVENRTALFPDAVTARGRRHVEELAALTARRHWQAGLLFVIQRDDAVRLRPAAHRDPAFARALAAARRAGVHVWARRCVVTLAGVRFDAAVPCEIGSALSDGSA